MRSIRFHVKRLVLALLLAACGGKVLDDVEGDARGRVPEGHTDGARPGEGPGDDAMVRTPPASHGDGGDVPGPDGGRDADAGLPAPDAIATTCEPDAGPLTGSCTYNMGTECVEVHGGTFACGPFPMGQTWDEAPCDRIERIGPCTYALDDGGVRERWFRPLAYVSGGKAPWPSSVVDAVAAECRDSGGRWQCE